MVCFSVLVLVSVWSLCKYAPHYLDSMLLLLLNRPLLLQLRAAYCLWGRTASSEQASDRLRIAGLLDFGLSFFINVVVLDVQLGQRPIVPVVKDFRCLSWVSPGYCLLFEEFRESNYS